MQRELNHWTDIVDMSIPFWWVRTFSGALLLGGLMCGLYNMYATAKSDVEYVEENHLIPATAD